MVHSIDEVRHRPTFDGARVPPHNLEAEESLLGSMMLSREAIHAAIEARISRDDFYKPAHGHIYDAVYSLQSRGEPVDPVTVAEELRRADRLDAIGGKPTLLRVQASTPASANAGHYAQIVANHAVLRRLIGVAGDITEMGYAAQDEVEETLDRAETAIFKVAEDRVTDSLRMLYPVLEETLDQLGTLYERGSQVIGVPTGYRDLDDLLHDGHAEQRELEHRVRMCATDRRTNANSSTAAAANGRSTRALPQPHSGASTIASASVPTPPASSAIPSASGTAPRSGSRVSRSSRRAGTHAARPSTRFTKNTSRQSAHSISSPPSDGPVAAATPPTAPHSAVADARRSGGNSGSSSPSEVGTSSAAPAACSTRAATSAHADQASPHSAEATMNSPSPTKNTRRRPSRSASRPAGTSSAAKTML